jgi:ABC-type multidrug transport system permease subunit
MVATPMYKSMFLAAQFIARMLLNFVESAVLITFTYFYFDIKIQGSLLALIIMIIVGNLAFTGMAILVSSRTANTQIGNGLINLVVMPMMILSGIFFSYHNFPDWAINVIQKLPLTILADTIRSIFIEGAGLAEITTGVIVLMSIGLVTFLTGLKFYRWY